MLGCPAGLFLDQWQRVNGCRCVAKEGSEIPTDPGRSFPKTSFTCLPVFRPIRLFKLLFPSLPFSSLHFSRPASPSSLHLTNCHSVCSNHPLLSLILSPWPFQTFIPLLSPSHVSPAASFLVHQQCFLTSSVLVTSWTRFLQLNVKFISTALKHSQSLPLSHHPRYEMLSESDKWKVISAIIQGFYNLFWHQSPDLMSCLYCFWLHIFFMTPSYILSVTSSSYSLVKSLLFSCVGGYKYQYTGNLSRQVRCTRWDEVMSLYPLVHLFKCSPRTMVIPPKSIMSATDFLLLCGH